jgi:hypothetical protein
MDVATVHNNLADSLDTIDTTWNRNEEGKKEEEHVGGAEYFDRTRPSRRVVAEKASKAAALEERANGCFSALRLRLLLALASATTRKGVNALQHG